jgi:hypothetical protein
VESEDEEEIASKKKLFVYVFICIVTAELILNYLIDKLWKSIMDQAVMVLCVSIFIWVIG